jgi:SAM-dependent methyltransferase
VRRALPECAGGHETWTRSLYQQVPRLLGAQPPFMNLGFVDENASLALDAADEPFRLNIQLYERALGGRPLFGQSVLESGCGGGGGIRYLARYHDPAALAGVDLLPGNVEACRLQTTGHPWRLEVADASRLPFPGESFDAVISIESSGHYERPLAFFREVSRVLKPGGALYLADLRPTGPLWGAGRDLASLRMELRQAGLAILAESDLSAGVLSSILLQEGGRRAFLDALALDPASRAHFDEIMLMQGSRNFEYLAAGDLRYMSLICEKSS